MAMNEELKFILKIRDEASAALRAAGTSVSDLGNKAEAARKDIERASLSKRSLAEEARQLVDALVPVSIALSAIAVSAQGFAQARAYEQTLTMMTTLAGESTESVAYLRKELLDLAVVMGRDPQEMADAMFYISSSGFEGAEGMKVLEASAKGASLGLGSVQEVADVVTSAMNTYKDENLQAADAVGILVKAIQQGKAEPAEFGASIGRVLGVAKTAGVEFDELAASIAALSQTGLPAAEGVSAVRQILQEFISQSPAGQKVLEQYGLNFEELQATLRDKGLLEAMKELTTAIPEEELYKVISGIEGQNAALLLAKVRAEDANEIFKQVASGGLRDLEEAFKTVAGTDNFKIDQGIALMNASLIRLGQEIIPPVAQIVGVLIGVFATLNENADLVRGTLVALGTLMGLMAARTFVLFAAGLIQSTGLFAAYAVNCAFAGSATATTGGFMLALATRPIPTLVLAFRALTAAMLANPWVAAAVGIAALAGWLVYVSGKSQEAAKANGAYAKAAATVSAVTQAASKNVQALATATGKEREAALKAAQADRDRILTLRSRAGHALMTAKAELALAEATAGRMQTEVLAATRSTRGAGGGTDPAITAINRAQPAFDKVEQARANAKEAQKTVDELTTSLREIEKALSAPALVPGIAPPAPTSTSPGGPDKKAEKSEYEQLVEAIQRKTRALEEDVFMEKQLQLVRSNSARQRAVEIAMIRAYSEQSVDIEDALAEKKITEDQAQALREKAQALAAIAGQKAATAFDTAQAEDNMKAAHALTVLSLQTEKYVEAAGLEQRAKRVRLAYLDAETAALQRGMSAEQARIEAQNAATAQTIQNSIDVADAHAEMWAEVARAREEQAMMTETLEMTANETEIYRAYVTALAEAHREGIPDAEAYARAMAEIKAKELELQNAPALPTARSGFRQWLEDMRQNAITTGKVVYDALNSTFDALGTALGRLVTGQKVGFRELFRNVVAGVAQMIAKALVWMAVTKLIALIPGGKAILAAMDSMAQVQTAVGAAKQAASVAKVSSAAGNLKSAKGNAFGSDIISVPTMHTYGGGKLGELGEAGPEAIMPLTRDAQGRLGVRGLGGGGSGVYAPTIAMGDIVIEFQGSGDARQDEASSKQLAKLVTEAVDTRLAEAMRRMNKPGGANNLGLGRGGN